MLQLQYVDETTYIDIQSCTTLNSFICTIYKFEIFISPFHFVDPYNHRGHIEKHDNNSNMFVCTPSTIVTDSFPSKSTSYKNIRLFTLL